MKAFAVHLEEVGVPCIYNILNGWPSDEGFKAEVYFTPLIFPPQLHDLSGLPFGLFETVCQKKVIYPSRNVKIIVNLRPVLEKSNQYIF